MADLAKIEPILKEFLTVGLGFHWSEIGSSLWTDERVAGYYWDAVEWRMVGKPSLHEWNPSSGVVHPVSAAQAAAAEITPEVEFWMSETGEQAGAVIDALKLPEIAALLPDPLYVKLAIAAAVILGVIIVMR